MASVAAQRVLPQEVVIADDGSTDETAQCIQHWRSRLSIPLKHIWQADEGFQAAKIRNRAIYAAGGDYLVFVDGDCVLRPNFIQAHARLAESGRFVSGNRLLLSKTWTEQFLGTPQKTMPTNPFSLLSMRLCGAVNRCLPLLSLPLGPLRRWPAKRWKGAKTCNLGIWRKDLLAINGFDESFTGWGFEDSDCVIRLLNRGVRAKNGRFATAVFHLWHKEASREKAKENWKRLTQLFNSPTTWADKGIDQYQHD